MPITQPSMRHEPVMKIWRKSKRSEEQDKIEYMPQSATTRIRIAKGFAIYLIGEYHVPNPDPMTYDHDRDRRSAIRRRENSKTLCKVNNWCVTHSGGSTIVILIICDSRFKSSFYFFIRTTGYKMLINVKEGRVALQS